MSEQLQIPTTTNLFIPPVSGNVSVPLAELDALRIAASNALSTAQILESQQRMVKVLIEEKYSGYSPQKQVAGYDLHGNPQYTYVDSKSDGKRIISMEMLNLGDIMPDLVQKATDDVKSAWDAQVKGLENSNANLEEKLKVANETLDRRRDEISELRTEGQKLADAKRLVDKERFELDIQVKKLEKAEKTFWKPMQERYTKLMDDYNKLRERKTLWGWIQAKIEEEGKPVKEDKDAS